MASPERWTGMGYVNVPGRILSRARWHAPILVAIRGDTLLIEVNLPLLRSVQRRVVAIADISYVQDADVATIGQYQRGIRLVGTDASVSFVWFRHAHGVRSALEVLGVEVRAPFDDSSPGYWGKSQYEP